MLNSRAVCSPSFDVILSLSWVGLDSTCRVTGCDDTASALETSSKMTRHFVSVAVVCVQDVVLVRVLFGSDNSWSLCLHRLSVTSFVVLTLSANEGSSLWWWS